MANPYLQMNPQMVQINGEIRDNFRALADGFQKLDKIEDSSRQSKLLEDLTGKMRECKRLIEEFDREIKVEESKSSPEVSKKLKDEKQSMIKALNSYMSFIKIYQNILGNKRVELFIMEAGNSEPVAEDNACVASEMLNQELNLAGNKTMDKTDQAIERAKKVVYQPVELGTQTAATPKRQTDHMGLVNEPDTIQVSIKKESQLVKETGHHVSTHHLPNNSPPSSSSVTPQFTQQQDLFQQFRQFQQQMQQPPSQQMQPPPPEPSRQRKGNKPARTPWTPDDETRLAQCWVHVSEEKKVGNSQTQESFWYQVMDEYNSGTSVQRRKDQLSSKWRDLNQHVTKFNGIYVKLTNERADGESDLNVMELALETYLRDGGHAFTHLHAWNVLKDKRKWLNPDPVVIGRRNKKRPTDDEEDSPINLDGHELLGNNANSCPSDKPKKTKLPTDEEDLPINLDDHELFGDDAIPCPPDEPKKPKCPTDEEDLPIDLDDHELFDDDAIPCPPSKPKELKSQRSSTTGERTSEGSSQVSVVLTERVLEKLSAILGKKADFMDQKIRLEQLKFLAFRTDGMLEQDRMLVEKEKAAIRKKYANL